MAREFSGRSLTIAVVLLVSGFEAITPDANDLASSMALRILGMQREHPGHSSDDDGADESGDLAGCEILLPISAGRSAEAPRPAVTCPIGPDPGADLLIRWSATSARPVPSILKSSYSGYRLDC